MHDTPVEFVEFEGGALLTGVLRGTFLRALGWHFPARVRGFRLENCIVTSGFPAHPTLPFASCRHRRSDRAP
ncbi:hypothetical protein GCM10022232_76580 [Streptomyces plumbiresistens]|uniref:Uncharacterized protein n=1 Tax=Streptomyces plumbiresistens TaxID=511811 RepID=A0ABP7T449_9ACTN